MEVLGADGAVIELVTRCSSAEEFIERFARFTTETEVIVPASPHVSVGAAGHFAICLKDRSVMMRGRCEVTELRSVAVAPGGRPAAPGVALMRLRLYEMDAHSCGIHLRLMERRASSPVRAQMPAPAPAAEAIPVAAPAADESVTVVSDTRPPSDTETTAEPPGETTAISPLPRPEARVAGAAFTLPANPLSDLDGEDLASFIELNFLETNRAVDAAPIAPRAPSARFDARLERARRIGRRFGPYAACLLGGLLVGVALRSASNRAPVAAGPEIAPPLAAAPPAPAATTEDEFLDPAPRDCVARVKTKPAGAAVVWGDIALGTSPIDHAAVPCGTASVTFRREHYLAVTRTITVQRKRRAVVVERLQRPPAKVADARSSPRRRVDRGRG